MRNFLRRLVARAAAALPEPPAPGDRMPPFPMIDGGALACPDLAASLVTLAVCHQRTAHTRHD